MLKHRYLSILVSFRALNGDYPNSNSFTSETDLHKFSIYYNAVKTVCKVPSNKRKEDEMKELLHELKYLFYLTVSIRGTLSLKLEYSGFSEFLIQ